MRYLPALFLCFLLAGFSPVKQDGLRVIDGDTFVLAGTHVRLWGIDAPEKRQSCDQHGRAVSCGQQAKLFLQQLLAHDARLDCRKIAKDRYRRIVARCDLDGRDLGEVMARNGWAMDFPRYSKRAYDGAQRQAMNDRRGVWGMRLSKPWVWRRLRSTHNK